MFSFAPLSEILPEWPQTLLPENSSLLEEIGLVDFDIVQDDVDFESSGKIAWLKEIELPVPALDSISLVLLGGDGMTEVGFTHRSQPDFEISLVDLNVALRLKSGLLRRVHKVGNEWSPMLKPNGEPVPVDIELSGTSVVLTADWNISIVNEPVVSIPAVEFGTTGLVLEISDIHLYLSDKQTPPAGAQQGFKGVAIKSAKLHLTGALGVSNAPDNFAATDLLIGSSGFSGLIEANWNSSFNTTTRIFEGSGSGTLFGIPFGLKTVGIELNQNSFQKSEIKGELLLPFFDEPVEVDIGVNVDGDFTVNLTGAGPDSLASRAASVASAGAHPLKKLTKPGVLEMELDSIGFELKDGVFMAKLSGQITPLFGKDQGMNWPGFKVEELSIDSKGHVHLQGGWLALREQYSLDFHGFHVGITKLGFGKTDDGGKWVGFSGELKLVDGFTAGASVEGLRVTWFDDGRDTRISFNGIGVEFQIPDVLYFKGDVAYRELQVGNELVHRFDGNIKLSLISLKLEIDAKLVVGSASGPQGKYNFFAIYLGVELPTGIPLSPTPLALYGMAGLFALQMEPDKHTDEEWYEGWFKRPEIGITDLEKKWVNRRGSLAFGVGATLGTSSDNGFTFACKALLVIVFPGPIFLLEGKANLLKERAKLNDDPMFRSLAVLDMRQGQILMGLDAKYKQDETGKVIDIRAGVEAFFHTPEDWHLYLGVDEPRTKRIRADIFKLFEANSYFMLGPKQLKTGAWVGYARQWKFGPVALTLEAWLEGNAVINWTPLHFHGDLWLHGNVEVKVFGFGLGLSVDARFAADVFDPFHVVASFDVSVKLPKPLKKKEFNITLEWGPTPDWPKQLPLPLKEVAIEHFKVTTSWPLPKDSTPPLLGPKYDYEKDGLRNYNSTPPAFSEPPLSAFPVVPLDCRPHISFGRNVNDDALVGVNPQLVQPEYERIGDPYQNAGPVKVRYSLKQIDLSKWDNQGQQWQTIAVAGRPLNGGERTLFGSWAPVPQLPSGVGQAAGANVKLWLWSRTPFDYTRHSGTGGDDWFTANFPDYPCIPQDIPDREICCDFEKLDRAQFLTTPWRSPGHPEISLTWQSPRPQSVTMLDPPVNGFTRALCFPIVPAPLSNSVMINLSAPAKRVKLLIVEKRKTDKVCLDFRKRQPGSVTLPLHEQDVTFGTAGLTDIRSVPTSLGDMTGLNCNVGSQGLPSGMNITLPCAATTVELTLSYLSPTLFDPTIAIAAFDSHGGQVAVKPMLNPQHQPEIVRFEGNDLKQITISAPRSKLVLHKLCFVCPDISPTISAIGFDSEDTPTAVFENVGNEVEISSHNMIRVQVSSRGEICLLKICALFGPDPQDLIHRQEMAAHLRSEGARWQDEGAVLEPFSAYRLTIATAIDAYGEGELSGNRNLTQTEHAYFRTAGPPGLTRLSLPAGRDPVKDADKFDSGLEDLTRYVRQTTPATVPAVGEKPVMAKPFYRAYDVGVEFNENHVDLMYRISGRDLGLYLYDSNNRPARDASGRLLVQSGDWGTVEELTLTEGEQRWLALSNADNGCLPLISSETIAHDKKLTSAIAGRVLEPDMIHEARLIPLLLREGFQNIAASAAAQGPAGKLGRWVISDDGDINIPSAWVVAETAAPISKYLTQTTNIKGGNPDASDPAKPGTMMVFSSDLALDSEHPEQPTNWTDYRLSVYLRAADGAIGFVFRYSDDNNYYRLSMDRTGSYRRLVSVANGIHTILGEDDFAYLPQQDYLLTVETIGNQLGIYQDGAQIFEITDATHSQGSIGLYCYASPGACFSDVRVDDFRQTAPVVYRFQFTTSLYANFLHHLHSYQDETWQIAVEGVPAAGPAMAKAVPPTTPLSDNEARAFETLATAVLGPAARQNPLEVQVSRVEIDGAPLAFLVQSPEPIDWLRTELSLTRTSLVRTEPALPGRVKLAAVKFSENRIDIDSVDLLLREPMDLMGCRIESRLVTWPVNLESGVVIDAQTLSDDGLAEQAWATYRLLEAEDKLPVGTIVKVQPSDAISLSSTGLVGIDAVSVDPSRRIFYSIELRLVAPDGVIVHARHFLPDGDYFPEDVNVLRKTDGTGFFMVKLDSGSSMVSFPLGQYRLKLTYHRNNKARVSTSQTFSQAGNDADEIVTLDIPL